VAMRRPPTRPKMRTWRLMMGSWRSITETARKWFHRPENRRAELWCPGPVEERDSIHDTCANGVLGGLKMRFSASGRQPEAIGAVSIGETSLLHSRPP